MPESATHKHIVEALKTKASMKQDVFSQTQEAFGRLQNVLEGAADSFAKSVAKDSRVKVAYSAQSKQDAKLVFGGDTLVFHQHTNVFLFNPKHPIWDFKYLKEDPYRGYCGSIQIYNFLSDSLKFNRLNDPGYLVGRLFVNREGHFFVESKMEMPYQAKDFGRSKASTRSLQRVVEELVMFSLNFDLLAPPYEAVQEVNVAAIQELTYNLKIRTGKRLGFTFEAKDTQVE